MLFCSPRTLSPVHPLRCTLVLCDIPFKFTFFSSTYDRILSNSNLVILSNQQCLFWIFFIVIFLWIFLPQNKRNPRQSRDDSVEAVTKQVEGRGGCHGCPTCVQDMRQEQNPEHYGVCVSTIISCICVCVLYCYYSIMYLQTKLLDVCFLLLFAALYTYDLNC